MKILTVKSLLLLSAVFCLQTTTAQTFIQAYADVVNQTSQTNVTANLTEYEALGVKQRGSAALQNTLNWLKTKYQSYGYTASQIVEDSYTYTYSGSPVTCKNVVVTKIGTLYPNTYVIVCGHYDSIVGTGTNDNGSGVVTILEVARLLQSVPTEYSVKFINFSGEEDGLRGSQHYVTDVVNATNPKMDIRLVFNIDEVGGRAGMANNSITCERDTGNPTTNNAASNTMTQELMNCVSLYSPLTPVLASAYASDYMTFENNNEIITGFFETNETPYAHTVNDLLVNMDPVYNFKVAKAAVGATLHFAKASVAALSQEDFQADFQISFFPNPAKGKLNINLGVLTNPNYTFSVVDINGKKVIAETFQNARQIETLDVSHLSSGVYLGILESGETRVTKKIVIE
ncbi:M20/M25/M40 family metallo-hydrolase [Flavobacterium suncheonense]|uniref:M20/M25/M40 family metallo-hydrolase n=1 Tax=Flavobacterium suncheonense TaxID=350894 RepID=UPI003FA3DC8B